MAIFLHKNYHRIIRSFLPGGLLLMILAGALNSGLWGQNKALESPASSTTGQPGSGRGNKASADKKTTASQSPPAESKSNQGKTTAPSGDDGSGLQTDKQNGSADSPGKKESATGDVSSPATDQRAADSDAGADQDTPIENPNPLLVRAEEHYFAERYHIALKLLKRVLDAEPENIQAYLYAGDIYLMQQNYGLAEEQFQIARELSKNPYKEWFRLGQVRLLRKDADQALAAFRESYKLRPDMHSNLFYMGMVYYQLKRDKAETIKAWREFRKLSPNDPQGPAIDKALVLIEKPDFQFPARDEGPCIQLNTAAETRQSYKPGENEKPKENNQTQGITEEDDL
ncbi:MAG: tetratricopeptide repeat protein [Leptospiraceae bacterium]|nr:tetratricopeptide repeat protein [Leptospiraceae bacterium]